MNYLDDDSLFTPIIYPAQYGIGEIKNWFRAHSSAMFRLIEDHDADYEFLNIDQKLEIYSGVKTFSVVTNPWLRLVAIYNDMVYKKNNEIDNDFVDKLNLKDFGSFVSNIPKYDLFQSSWFSATTPQVEWLITTANKTDFIFKYETLNTDMEVFYEYFQSDNQIIIHNNLCDIDYKSFYSRSTKNLVMKLFQKDIEYFNYKF